MKKINIGINGLGRIGRTLVNYWARNYSDKIQITAVNNPGKAQDYLHLLKYDSIHGKFPFEVKLDNEFIIIGDNKIKFFNQKNPAEIDWSSQNVDIVIDSTGIFKDKEALSAHMKGSVKKVIMCAPGKQLDGTFVMGINSDQYDTTKHHFISNASCTTNCLAPVAKVLEENLKIINGFMTTVHSYTNDQNLLDNSHSDLRRARAAALSMIPTTTGAAKALGEVIPSLKGKLDGYAVRVPTPNVSMVDLTVNVEKSTTIAEINAMMKKASETHLQNILAYTDEELVSTDFMGRTESSIFDSALTNVIGNTVKIVSWYDNEVGFSNRVLDLATFVGSKL